jgi:hypothetical protein
MQQWPQCDYRETKLLNGVDTSMMLQMFNIPTMEAARYTKNYNPSPSRVIMHYIERFLKEKSSISLL